MAKILNEGALQICEMTVGKGTNVHNLSLSISKYVQDGLRVRLVAIGPNAVNQMVKGSAKATGHLAPVGKYVSWKVFFTDRMLTEEEMADPSVLLEMGGVRKEKLSALCMETMLM